MRRRSPPPPMTTSPTGGSSTGMLNVVPQRATGVGDDGRLGGAPSEPGRRPARTRTQDGESVDRTTGRRVACEQR